MILLSLLYLVMVVEKIRRRLSQLFGIELSVTIKIGGLVLNSADCKDMDGTDQHGRISTIIVTEIKIKIKIGKN